MAHFDQFQRVTVKGKAPRYRIEFAATGGEAEIARAIAVGDTITLTDPNGQGQNAQGHTLYGVKVPTMFRVSDVVRLTTGDAHVALRKVEDK